MRVAVLGRSQLLRDAAVLVRDAGHIIPIVWTNRAEDYYVAGRDEFMQLAVECGAEFRDRLPQNAAEFVGVLREHNCDIAISVNWLGMIPQAVLDLMPHGVLNAHAGDLPRYRGNAGPNWAILAGEPHVGVVVHLMVPELDAGPILVTERLPLTSDTYIGDVYHWLEQTIPPMFLRAVTGLEKGSIAPQPQDPAIRPLRAYPRRPEDSLIDWTASAESVVRLVRASSRPFSGAYTFLGAQRINVWRARVYAPPFDYHAISGQVCLQLDGYPVIATPNGMVQLLETSSIDTDDAATRTAILKSLRNRLRDVPT